MDSTPPDPLRRHQIELELQNRQLRRMQIALEVARDRYADLFQLAPVPFLVLDQIGRVVKANPAATTLLGVPEDGLIGAGLLGFMSEEEVARYERYRRAALRSREAIDCSLRLDRADRTLDLRLVSRAARRAGHCVMAMIDLSEHQQTARELAQRSAGLDAVLDTIGDGVVVTAPGGRIERINRAAEALFGYSVAMVTGADIRTLLPCGAQREGAPSWLCEPGLPAPPAWRGEVIGRREDGSEFPLELIVTELRGPTPARVWTLRDLSARERVERAMREADKLDALALLAGGVAHDANNLLMSIRSCADEALQADDEASVRARLETIRRAALEGAQINRHLLVFQTGDEAEPAPIELDAEVAAQAALLGRLIGPEVELQLQLQAPERVIVLEPDGVGRILLNLAVNARDAMPGGGRLQVSTRVVEAAETGESGSVPAPCVELLVSDTGCGMDEGTRLRAFDAFYTTRETGTGLGLTVVSGVVRAAGGALAIDSEVGVGTTIRVRFPLSAQAPTPEPIARADGQGTGVLLVEDMGPIRRVIREELQEAGYRVLEASTGAEAVALIRDERVLFGLVLSDITLPDGDGLQVSEALAAARPRVPIVFMSGRPANTLQRAGLLQPGCPLLQKPFSTDELMAALDTARHERPCPED